MDTHSISIDINQAPPSPAQLEDCQRHSVALQNTARRNKKALTIVFVAMILMAVVALYIRWFDGRIDPSSISDDDVSRIITACLFGTVVATFVLGWFAGWVAASVVMLSGLFGIDQIEVAAVLELFVIYAVFTAYDVLVTLPAEAGTRQLSALAVLNAHEHPDACIEYEELRNSTPQVAAYHQQIIEQGRRPVLMEYEAARAWVASERKRQAEEERRQAAEQRRQQAIAACERLSAEGSEI